jgi:hypothetical protein
MLTGRRELDCCRMFRVEDMRLEGDQVMPWDAQGEAQAA